MAMEAKDNAETQFQDIIQRLRRISNPATYHFAGYLDAMLRGDIERAEEERKNYIIKRYFVTEADVEEFDRYLEDAIKNGKIDERLLDSKLFKQITQRRRSAITMQNWKKQPKEFHDGLKKAIAHMFDPHDPEHGRELLMRAHWNFLSVMGTHETSEDLGKRVYAGAKSMKKHVPITVLANIMVFLHPYIREIVRRRRE